jgi:serine-type D-Ala-D-Ala endopeptidase (penicillin-binding protein 7)
LQQDVLRYSSWHRAHAVVFAMILALVGWSFDAGTGINQAQAKTKVTKAKVSSKKLAKSKGNRARLQRLRADPIIPAKPSLGQAIGLHSAPDHLGLKSSVALVVEQASGKILFEKNSQAVLPIASITKLMSALVVVESLAPMGELIEVTEADRDIERKSRSRLPIGSVLTRKEMLQLALMSSENRAASALGRHHPGGMPAFIQAMNLKAKALGMRDSSFDDPTGLSSSNTSNARDLVTLMRAVYANPLLRSQSVSSGLEVDTGARQIMFRNTNRLLSSESWSIGLSKTGYITDAGNCLVMQARMASKPSWVVLLDAQGKLSRYADAGRIRKWLEDKAV